VHLAVAVAARTAREHGMTDEARERDPQVRARKAPGRAVFRARPQGPKTLVQRARLQLQTAHASARPARDRHGCPHLLFSECLERGVGVLAAGAFNGGVMARVGADPASTIDPRRATCWRGLPGSRLRAPPAPISRPRPLHPGPPCGHLAGDRRRVRERDSGKCAWAPEQCSGRVLDPSTRRQSFALFTSRDLTVGCKTVKRYAGVRAQ
jgi:hypothetical protein